MHDPTWVVAVGKRLERSLERKIVSLRVPMTHLAFTEQADPVLLLRTEAAFPSFHPARVDNATFAA